MSVPIAIGMNDTKPYKSVFYKIQLTQLSFQYFYN